MHDGLLVLLWSVVFAGGLGVCLWLARRGLPRTYVRDVLHSTSAVFGVLNTLIGIGMIIGTQLLTRFARHIPQQNLVVYGLGGMGIAVLTTAAFGTMGSTAAPKSASPEKSVVTSPPAPNAVCSVPSAL